MRKHAVFMFRRTIAILRQLLADFLHFRHSIGINAVGTVLRHLIFQLFFQSVQLRFAGSSKAFAHFFFQPALEIMIDFRRARIEYAVNAKIQLRPVDLEDFFQLPDEVVVFAHIFYCE
jgi:hypothetical protein